MKKPLVKKIITIFVLFFFLFLLIFLIKKFDLINKLNNLQKIKTLILSSGFWCYGVFALLQFLQVVLLPIPASITTIAGVIIFGPLTTFFISTISVILASICAFLLGKFLGRKFLCLIIGETKLKNFQDIIQNQKLTFFIMMLFPFFPDDILCFVAGVSNIDFKFFLFTNIITRTIGFFSLCFLGSGYIIPFNSWGILVWILIILFIIVFFVYYKKNKDKISNFLKQFNKKFFNKKKP